MKIGFFLLLAAFALTGSAQAIPNIWGVWTWDHTEPVQVVVTPAGGGTPLSQAHYFGGTVTDATIRVQLWVQDDNMQDPQPPAPVANFPAEDLWLEAPGVFLCAGGSQADADTDAEGWFTFSLPLGMGGWADPAGDLPYFTILVSGVVLRDEFGSVIRPAILANSPDINGDLEVNLVDVGLFAEDLFGAYSFRSDFYWDGIISLSDVGLLAGAMGDGCD